MSRRRSLLLLMLAAIMLLSACGQGGTYGKGDPTYQAADVNASFVQGQTDFSFSLYKQIIEEEGDNENLFISPLSIALALAITYNGADGETKEAMEQALQLQGLSIEEVNQAFQILKDVLEHADPEIELNINESLWMQNGTKAKETFLQNMTEYYGAEVTELDFSQPESVKRINKWVDDRTNGKIEKIVDHLDPNTVMVLLNTVYFLGTWSEPFLKESTQNMDFHLPDGKTKKHPLMRQSGDFHYYEDELLQSVKLPYSEGRFSMYVFLPKEDKELADVTDKLMNQSAEKWKKMLDNYAEKQGNIAIPRFELEYEIQLNQILKNMGMGAAFGGDADFSNMIEGGGIWVDEVKHKTYIRTDEKGTEAAASTMVMMPTSAPVDLFSMIVDRPFFFLIKEEETNSILFMGSIVNPEDV